MLSKRKNPKVKKMSEIICWRGSDGDSEPIRCVCESEFGYPNYCRDAEGNREMMYVNTHFLDIADAWQSLRDSATAGVKLSGRAVAMAKERLREAEERAGRDCERFAKITDGYYEFQKPS